MVLFTKQGPRTVPYVLSAWVVSNVLAVPGVKAAGGVFSWLSRRIADGQTGADGVGGVFENFHDSGHEDQDHADGDDQLDQRECRWRAAERKWIAGHWHCLRVFVIQFVCIVKV